MLFYAKKFKFVPCKCIKNNNINNLKIHIKTNYLGMNPKVSIIIGSLMSQQKQADAIAAVKDYYQNKLRSFTEMEEDTSQTDKRILTNKGSLVVILNTIFDSYVKAINTVYSDNIKPNVFKEAETEYNKIQGYQKMMDSNETKKAALNGAITRL